MATFCGLGQGIKVLKGDISRSTLAGWRKEVLVDALMSLALSSGAIPGVQKHLEAAHKLSIASPANGGGMEAARTYLKGVELQSNSECLSPEDDADAVDDSNGSGSTLPTDQRSPPLSLSSSASQSHVTGGDCDRGPGLCRSNWKGIRCADDTCSKVHREYCLLHACYPIRNANCLLWHPRSWTAPNVQGNGRKGNGQPFNKAAKSKPKTGVNAGHKDTILSRENKLLRQEIALFKERSRLEARKHAQPHRKTAYRDAVMSGLPRAPLPVPQQRGTPCAQPLATQVQPETHLPSPGSDFVLPPGILAAIQLAVEKALQNRNPH